jgi:hypothetical protein
MKTKTLLLAALCTGLIATPALADDDRPDHFKGEPAPTLDVAVSNFSTYNQELATLLAQDELSPEDLASVHQLTYTLENALEKITAEVETMAETLEEVHLGSETNDPERVQDNGATYLEAAQTLVP